jgi:Protein of unknown function (DUF3237)
MNERAKPTTPPPGSSVPPKARPETRPPAPNPPPEPTAMAGRRRSARAKAPKAKANAAKVKAAPRTEDPIGLRYCFTVDSSLRVPEPVLLAKGPEGTRVNVVYGQDAKVTSPLARVHKSWPSKGPRWSGLAGTVVSGGDFYLVRTDGVLELDGRVTIESDDHVIIEALYNGLIDLYPEEKAKAVPATTVANELKDTLPGDAERRSIGAIGATLRSALASHAKASEKALNGAADAIAASLPDAQEVSRAAIAVLHSAIDATLQGKAKNRARAQVEEAVRAALHGDGKKALDPVEAAITHKYRNEEFDEYEDFLGGRDVDKEIKVPVQLMVSFETSSGPFSDTPDEDLSWVAEHYLVSQTKFWKYRRLTRNSYIATGTLTLTPQGKGKIPLAKHIQVDVFELDRPNPRK